MMHIDARKLDEHTDIQGDICIVGMGAAGITLALALKNIGRNILLIEGGGFDADHQTQSLNDGENTGQKYYPLESSRLRFFGGTTNHWAGWCAPLDPIDFEKRTWVPNSGWPITYDELAPYYIKAQQLCELEHNEILPLDWDKIRPTEYRLGLNEKKFFTKIFQKSTPTHFGSKYRDDILNAKNLQLYTHCNAVKIQLNEAGSAVQSIVTKTLNGRTQLVSAKHFILACGALQNVRLLLASKNVQANGIGNQYDQVGRYFMEHPHVDTANMLLDGSIDMNIYNYYQPTRSFGLVATSPDFQRHHLIGNYSSFLYNTPLPDSEDQRSLTRKIKDRLGWSGRPPYLHMTLSTRIEQSPNPDSRVTLSREMDSLGVPKVKLHWKLLDLDRHTIRTSNLELGKELGRQSLGRLQLQTWQLDDSQPWPENLEGGFHHMGIARMSASAKTGVVNQHCTLHNLPNLHLAGSAVFPTSGVANPTLTIVALAAKLADHIKRLV